MDTTRKKRSIRISFNNLLRAITRKKRNDSPSTPVSTRFRFTDRKTESSYQQEEEAPEPTVTTPLSARGPRKTNFNEYLASSPSLKNLRRLSIDQFSATKAANLFTDLERPKKQEQTPKSNTSSPTTQGTSASVKRLSHAVKKIKQDEALARSVSAMVEETSSTRFDSPTINDDRQYVYNLIDSDTSSVSTMDESSTFEEEDDMSFLPPPTFNLDEYSQSMMSLDTRTLASTCTTEEQTIEQKVLELTARGTLDELRTLLESNPELACCTDKDGSTPLHIAARFNRADVVEMLITEPYYADINCKDQNDSTPLHWAAVHASLEAILSLCKNSAQINIRDKYGKGPLHLAIVKKCYRGADVMLLYGADINFKRADGSSAFHIACELGDVGTIEWLVRKDKVMVNCRDKQGETPLLRAATQGKLEVVEYIMKTQLMSWNARDDKQQSLLHRAAFYGYYDLISRIAFINPAACKTMLNEPDRFGETPLHMAVKRDHFREVKLLCKMGADPSLKNRNGDTPLHHAIKYRRMKIARYLFMTAKDTAEIRNKKGESSRSMAKRLGLDVVALFQ